MIVYAGIVPHSPLLVPSVGKEHREKLELTLKAYREMEEQLYLAKPDTLVIFSPHAQMYPDAFSGNVSDKYVAVMKEFGDHGTAIPAKADFLLLDHIHRHMREEQIPFTMTSSAELDYGFTVPLLLLTPQLQHWKLVPLATSLLDARAHYGYGQELKRVLHAEQSRIAVIASVDLSHHVNAESPQGANPEGQQFDAMVRKAVVGRDPAPLLALDPQTAEKAGQCAQKTLLQFFGALHEMNGVMLERCYEAPFGVGLLTAQFQLA